MKLLKIILFSLSVLGLVIWGLSATNKPEYYLCKGIEKNFELPLEKLVSTKDVFTTLRVERENIVSYGYRRITQKQNSLDSDRRISARLDGYFSTNLKDQAYMDADRAFYQVTNDRAFWSLEGIHYSMYFNYKTMVLEHLRTRRHTDRVFVKMTCEKK